MGAASAQSVTAWTGRVGCPESREGTHRKDQGWSQVW